MSADLRAMWIAVGGNVPEDWCFQTIESLLADQKSIAVGVMYPGENTVDGVPLIKVGDIKNGKVQGRPSFCISPEVDYEYRRTKLSGNELLITLVGEPGDCAIASEEMKGWNAARAIAVVRLADTDLRSWLRYVLLSKPAKHLIEARLNTTVQKTLNLKDIRALGVPVPSKLYRESVTKLLSALDDKIALNCQINQTLEAMAQAIFKSWFVDFDPVKAKIAAIEAGQDPLRAAMSAISGKTSAELDAMPRPQYDELAATAALFPDEMVESELGDVPKGWGVKSISEICDLNPSSWNSKTLPDSVRYVDLASTKNGEIVDIQMVEGTDIPSRARRTLKFGDTIFGTVRPANRSFAFVGEEDLTGSTGFAVLRPKADHLREYLYLAVTTDENIERLAHLADGGAYPAVKPELVIANLLATPNDDLILAFHKTTSVMFVKIIENRHMSLNLAQLRDTLLPKLLSGELSVAELEEVV